MLTYKEMTDREEAARTRAWKFGRAKEAASAARERLTNLEAKLAAPRLDVSALNEIIRLADSVPGDLVTTGSTVVPGGQNLRWLITTQCEAALTKLAKDRKRLEDSLPEAREKCRQAEEYLATLTQ
jgi:hypothetical protein